MIKRNEWKELQLKLDRNRLIFLDETSINAGMTRLYGRALEGERVIDYVPDVRFKRLSVLSSVRLDGTMELIHFEGTLNGELFALYIKKVLGRTLGPGDIVVMDNCSCHKVQAVIDAITATGARVMFLPPYSPDFNPIELVWSKFKSQLKKVKARSYDSLVEQIMPALETITLSDIDNFFKHSGYSA